MSSRGAWRAELRTTLILAAPMALTQLGQMALNIVDTLLIAHLGTEALAAAALGTALFFVFFLFGMGTLFAVASLAAQAHGAEDARGVSRTVGQGLVVSLALALLMIGILGWTEDILLLAGQQPGLAARAGDYLHWMRWSLVGGLPFVVLRGFVSALDRPQPALWVMLLGVPANGLLAYALIFGEYGAPRLELAGAGIATSLVALAMTLALLAWSLRAPRFRLYRIHAHLGPPGVETARILKIGLPIGATLVMEMGLFSGAMMMMGWIGPDEVAAHQVALQIIAFLFMVPLGLSQAATVRVGSAHGRGDAAGVRIAGWVALALGTAFMIGSALLIWAAPAVLVHLFLTGADSARAAALAVAFLYVAGFFQVMDGGQVIGGAVLRGLNDTRIPMVMAGFGYWLVGLPTGYLLAFQAGLGGVGIWMGLAAGLGVTATLLILRFRALARYSPQGQAVAPPSQCGVASG